MMFFSVEGKVVNGKGTLEGGEALFFSESLSTLPFPQGRSWMSEAYAHRHHHHTSLREDSGCFYPMKINVLFLFLTPSITSPFHPL